MKTSQLPGSVSGIADNRTDDSLNRLLPQVYSELKRLAAYHLKNERSDHTLRPTELVHEVYLLLRTEDSLELKDHKQFLSLASTVMRHVLVNYAKHKKRMKRGDGTPKIPIDEIREVTIVQFKDRKCDYIELEDALIALEKRDKRIVRVVELKYFGGMTDEEAAEEIGISSRTVKRDWKLAKAFLFNRLNGVSK